MKFCIYGAGAIGGYVGGKLALQGYDVSFIARGANLAALRERGLTLITEEKTQTIDVACYEDPSELGHQDFVLIALKSGSVPNVLDSIQPLLHPETTVVTMQNGILWWYFYQHEGAWNGHTLNSCDPKRNIWNRIGPERVVGSVVYLSCELIEPGVVKYLHGNRLMVGEPDGIVSERVKLLSEALCGAGFKAPVRRKIREDIWLKLLGNCTFNPVSALTTGTMEQIADDSGVRSVIHRMMQEATATAAQFGVKLSVDIDTRINWSADVGAHKTSMLQDLERGKPMEIDTLLGAVVEMAHMAKVPVPTLETVLHLVRLRAELSCSAGVS